jgi:hypothetical protein
MDTQCLLCEAGNDLLNITSTAYHREITGGCIKLRNDKCHDCSLRQPIIKSKMRGVRQVTHGCEENRIKDVGKKNP